MYNPNIGLETETRKTSILKAYKEWKKLSGFTGSFEEFQGSNIHLIVSWVFDHLDQAYKNSINANYEIFEYIKDVNLGIQGSLGSSYEGWINSFRNLCTGLDIVSSDDKRISKLAEAKRPTPGEIIVYFDNLTTDPKKENDIHQAWIRCKNVSEPTKDGDQEITLTFSNGDIKKYKYFNLEPKDYTEITVGFKIIYQDLSVQYEEERIKKHIQEKFDQYNKINKSFYPKTVIDITNYPGVQDIEISVKLTTEQDSAFVKVTKEIDLNKKFIIKEIKVIV